MIQEIFIKEVEFESMIEERKDSQSWGEAHRQYQVTEHTQAKLEPQWSLIWTAECFSSLILISCQYSKIKRFLMKNLYIWPNTRMTWQYWVHSLSCYQLTGVENWHCHLDRVCSLQHSVGPTWPMALVYLPSPCELGIWYIAWGKSHGRWGRSCPKDM